MKFGAILAAGAVAMLALTTGSVSANAAQVPQGSHTSRMAKAHVEMRMMGIKLTHAQAAALRHAAMKNRKMTPAQALAAAGVNTSKSAMRPMGSGTDSSVGDCSYIKLYGDSNGYYTFTQYIYTNVVGSAVTGNIAISTDGINAAEDDYDPEGAGQSYAGTLSDTGALASGTTMNGWMETSNGNYCAGSLYAIWQ